jgi:hypothetical protein
VEQKPLGTHAPLLHSMLGGQSWPAEQAAGTGGSGAGTQEPRALSQLKPLMQSASLVQTCELMQVPEAVSQNWPAPQSVFEAQPVGVGRGLQAPFWQISPWTQSLEVAQPLGTVPDGTQVVRLSQTRPAVGLLAQSESLKQRPPTAHEPSLQYSPRPQSSFTLQVPGTIEVGMQVFRTSQICPGPQSVVWSQKPVWMQLPRLREQYDDGGHWSSALQTLGGGWLAGAQVPPELQV